MIAVPAGSEQAGTSLGTAPEAALLGGAGWADARAGARVSAKFANLIRRAAIRSSATCRLRRGRLFVERLRPTEDDSIIDLGGGRGGHIAGIVPFRRNVTIGELDAAALRDAAETYGFRTLHLDGGEKFPVA